MSWFKRTKKGIQTPTEEKKDVPKGLWYKSPTGKIVDSEELEKNFYVSPEDGYHVRIGSNEYFELLFDDNKYKELDKNLTSKDPLKFRPWIGRLSDRSPTQPSPICSIPIGLLCISRPVTQAVSAYILRTEPY